MADPQDKDPAEGSRETIDHELQRQDDKQKKAVRDGAADQKGPAQPR